MTPATEIQVKICGLTRESDVRAADAAGAAYLGFIFAPSKRQITAIHARNISQNVSAKRVAVTVNACPAELETIMSVFTPDFIQFHGDETPEQLRLVANRFDVGTIKAVPISTASDLKTARDFTDADLILCDAKPPKNSSIRGGHGNTIDWSLFRPSPLPKNFMLAGGLTPENVAAAITATQAPIVDVASGVESEPGIKDHDKIRAFIRATKDIS